VKLAAKHLHLLHHYTFFRRTPKVRSKERTANADNIKFAHTVQSLDFHAPLSSTGGSLMPLEKAVLTHLRNELFAADRLLDEVTTDLLAAPDEARAVDHVSYRLRAAICLIEAVFEIEPLPTIERTEGEKNG
jgi:hypothetical protein